MLSLDRLDFGLRFDNWCYGSVRPHSTMYEQTVATCSKSLQSRKRNAVVAIIYNCNIFSPSSPIFHLCAIQPSENDTTIRTSLVAGNGQLATWRQESITICNESQRLRKARCRGRFINLIRPAAGLWPHFRRLQNPQALASGKKFDQEVSVCERSNSRRSWHVAIAVSVGFRRRTCTFLT